MMCLMVCLMVCLSETEESEQRVPVRAMSDPVLFLLMTSDSRIGDRLTLSWKDPNTGGGGVGGRHEGEEGGRGKGGGGEREEKKNKGDEEEEEG